MSLRRSRYSSPHLAPRKASRQIAVRANLEQLPESMLSALPVSEICGQLLHVTCLCIYIYIYIERERYICIYTYTCIYIYIYKIRATARTQCRRRGQLGRFVALFARSLFLGLESLPGNHRWDRNPRPQPDTFSRLVPVMELSEYYMVQN